MRWFTLRIARHLNGLASRLGQSKRRPTAMFVSIEAFEARAFLSASALSTLVEPMSHFDPAATTAGPTGITPAQVRHAYGFDQITFGTVRGDGTGQTIAIVDAYDHPNIASDLHIFDTQFGLADPVFTKKTMATKVRADSGWALEIALDVEWAHAVAPGAKILLVEAKSASMSDLFDAVDYARSQPGVTTVSMSWGGNEFSSEGSYDSHFTTPAGHAGVTFVASSGDSGSPAGYPAVSPKVLSVGGTRLTADASGNYGSETGWASSGGGISTYESKPAYQSALTQSATKRVGPDVAYNGDPNSGFPVYDSIATQGRSGWFQVGGTSAGSPQWAALVAIADQGRALASKPSLYGDTQTQQALYNMAAADFHDITSGNNGFAAGAGFDLVTGRGSPRANLVVGDLVSASTTGATTSGSTAGSGNIYTPASPGAAPNNSFDWNEWASKHNNSPFTVANSEPASGFLESLANGKKFHLSDAG
jgi:subtilase family serine protease